MTDAEISRRLALAIGWEPNNVTTQWGKGEFAHCFGGVQFVQDGHGSWRLFDYRDPSVIWPVAERFNCFPEKYRANRYPGADEILWSAKGVVADTAAKAVALAVIKHHEGIKT